MPAKLIKVFICLQGDHNTCKDGDWMQLWKYHATCIIFTKTCSQSITLIEKV